MLEERGVLFIAPGEKLYEGMIIGENAKPRRSRSQPAEVQAAHQLPLHRQGRRHPPDPAAQHDAGTGDRLYRRRRDGRSDAAEHPPAQALSSTRTSARRRRGELEGRAYGQTVLGPLTLFARRPACGCKANGGSQFQIGVTLPLRSRLLSEGSGPRMGSVAWALPVNQRMVIGPRSSSGKLIGILSRMSRVELATGLSYSRSIGCSKCI